MEDMIDDKKEDLMEKFAMTEDIFEADTSDDDC